MAHGAGSGIGRSWCKAVSRVAKRALAVLALATLMTGTLVVPLLFSPATASAQPGPEYAVGAVGTDGALWVQTPQLGSGWHSLGGHLLAAPAIAALPQPGGAATPLFVALGTDHQLWVRSLANGWQPLTSAYTYCVDSPAATLSGQPGAPQLIVACEGGPSATPAYSNNALWTATAGLTSTGLPNGPFSGWTYLGGELAAGPALAPSPDGNGFLYFAVIPGGEVVYNHDGIWNPTVWRCSADHLAAGMGQTIYVALACRGPDGQLWTGSSLSSFTPVPQGGGLTGGPGVAIDSGDLTLFFAEGTDHAVWTEEAGGAWTSLGGQVVGGVAAVGLN